LPGNKVFITYHIQRGLTPAPLGHSVNRKQKQQQENKNIVYTRNKVNQQFKVQT